MSASLENRSSLRKLEFPHCTHEALKRLSNTMTAVSHKTSLSPKETELVLDVIDEFVFFTKPSLSKSRRLNSPISELQLMQVLVDFYNSSQEHDADSAMIMLTNYLFMDPPGHSKRVQNLERFAALAVGLKSKTVLHYLGLWMQQNGANSDRAVVLCQSIMREYVLLVQDSGEALYTMPAISPVFAVNFLASVTELYTFKDKWPPLVLVKIMTKWMESKDALLQLGGAQWLAGLARWTILHPALAIRKNVEPDECSLYGQLHLATLESLAEIKEHQMQPKTCIQNKKLVLLCNSVETALKENSSNNVDFKSSEDICLDRLGQFLHCATAAGCVQGKLGEVVATVQRLALNNRLLQMYVSQFGKN